MYIEKKIDFENPCKIKIHFFFQKWSNLHERSGIGLIERKTKFQIFPIFIFRIIQKNTVAGNSLNAVEREPVPTRVINPKACGVQRYSPGVECANFFFLAKWIKKIFVHILSWEKS